MIIKNEEARLTTCPQSVVDLVKEIVVVDSDSNDQTKAIAARSNARVHDFAWINDFSAARNESWRHASGEWTSGLMPAKASKANRRHLRALFNWLLDANVAYVMTLRVVPLSIRRVASLVATLCATGHVLWRSVLGISGSRGPIWRRSAHRCGFESM